MFANTTPNQAMGGTLTRVALSGWLLMVACGCDGGQGGDGGVIKPPPQVFLTLDETNVIDVRITGKVNVTGCKSVAQVQLLESGKFLADLNYSTSPTTFELKQGLFATLWTRGIAGSFTFTAYVQCDDGRNNTSQPVGVSFFPVASRLSTGSQMLPDAFIVEGGLGGSAVSFLGCLSGTTGNVVGRVDLSGNITATIKGDVPVCDDSTEVSEVSRATGTRWILQPGAAAYAVDKDLKVIKRVNGVFHLMAVDPQGGSVILYDSTINSEHLVKADPVASTSNDWQRPIAGIPNATPIFDFGMRIVWLATWQLQNQAGGRRGDVVTWKLNLDTGALLNGLGPGGVSPPIILSQDFGQTVNKPIQPQCYFNADGTLIFIPAINTDLAGVVHTTVIACSTAAMCDASTPARYWTSETFDGIVNLVIPFSKGNLLAAVGPYQAWFLDTQQGRVLNLSHQAIRPSGNLQILGLQPGIGSDLYLLNGPASESGSGYPVEAVAVDAPTQGELWRFSYGAGASPVSGITMGVDQSGQTWFRVGADQVKPHPLVDYRAKRGPTMLP